MILGCSVVATYIPVPKRRIVLQSLEESSVGHGRQELVEGCDVDGGRYHCTLVSIDRFGAVAVTLSASASV